MTLRRRLFLRLAGAAVAAPAFSQFASALDYPTQSVRWIVGYPPGNAADTVVRIMGRWLSERFNQPVVIENKPGAATNISVQAAINSPPDGYTLIYVSASTAINATLYEALPFNFLRDVAAVAGLVVFPFVMVAGPSVRSTTLADFIAYAKEHPGKISMASFGTGSTSHMAGELFKKMAGVNLIHVPYRGSGAAHIDMMSGRMDVMFDTLGATLPHIRSGALRALAVTGKTRYEGLPDLPTANETVPGYVVSGWAGVGAPKATPHEVIEKLNREISAGLASPVVKARLADVAAVPMPLTQPEFAAFAIAETERWAEVVKLSGAKPD
jgi:tripartite-type tricarboxylate transporter receptor subunit TctC